MLLFELPAASGYVVALSGGADSRLLLELTVRAVSARGDTVASCVRAAHLHHGIRGAEADRDEAFCRAECERLGVPLTVGHADIPALAAENGQSEETAARHARYAFLTLVMKTHGLPALLTAHNADDQLETVLFHLLRGSGTRGMIGIPAERPLGDTLPDGTALTVYRPLLAWSRREILQGISELGLSYVTDSTNRAEACTRNRLRHRVTPIFEEMTNAGLPQAAAVRLGQAAQEDEEALAAIAAERYQGARLPQGLPVAAVAQEPPAIAKRMIRMAYADRLGAKLPPDRSLSAHHLDMLLRLCREKRNGQVSDPLPAHLRAEIHGGCLCFVSYAPTDRTPARTGKAPCRLGMGLTVWDDTPPRITVEVETAPRALFPPTDAEVFASACFPVATASALTARPREPGDVILSHGMTKKLKKLICDHHIPLDLRDRLPLICLGDGTPLWFPGVAFRDGFSPPTDAPVARVTIRIHTSATRE